MTLAQSKKFSQFTADNAQWEDLQLIRSGAVRGTEVQTEFDDEEERRVILLVHGINHKLSATFFLEKIINMSFGVLPMKK